MRTVENFAKTLVWTKNVLYVLRSELILFIHVAGYLAFGGLVWTVKNAAKTLVKTKKVLTRNRKQRFSKTH